MKALSPIRLVILTVMLLTFVCTAVVAKTPQEPQAGNRSAAHHEKQAIKISGTTIEGEMLIVRGHTAIDPKVSTYIQYYVGKEYRQTVTTCILSAGFSVGTGGDFLLEIPLSRLKGAGQYSLVLEQNARANGILPPKHWQAFAKTDKGIEFGDITSMGEISNLALTVGMEIAATEFTLPGEEPKNDQIHIDRVKVKGDRVVVTGRSAIDPTTSTYIQYYIGKSYQGTLSECILSDGFQVGQDGSFHAEIPVQKLKGAGEYLLVLEQNPKGNKILPPHYWQAFAKTDKGLEFGAITSMGEISNLALTVGMQTASADFSISGKGTAEKLLSITSTRVEKDQIIVTGKSSIPTATSSYIQYYVGKEFPGTLSNCILCAGIETDKQGNFTLVLPVAKLKGAGRYSIVLEQNPRANSIIAPNHWMAFYKEDGAVHFGDISAMQEISNLALTVGMAIVDTEVEVR